MVAFIALSAIMGVLALVAAILHKVRPPKPKRHYFIGIDPATSHLHPPVIVRGYTEGDIIHIEKVDP